MIGALDNRDLKSMAESLLHSYFDENLKLIHLGILNRSVIMHYIKALYRLDYVRESLSTFKRMEFVKDTVVVDDIGYYLLESLKDALRTNDRQEVKRLIEQIKKETNRIYEQYCGENGYSVFEQQDPREILAEYVNDESEYLNKVKKHPKMNMVVASRRGYRNKSVKNTTK